MKNPESQDIYTKIITQALQEASQKIENICINEEQLTFLQNNKETIQQLLTNISEEQDKNTICKKISQIVKKSRNIFNETQCKTIKSTIDQFRFCIGFTIRSYE
jgi:hypothetical protein